MGAGPPHLLSHGLRDRLRSAGHAATVPRFSPVAEEDVVLVGARELDPAEAELLRGSRVRHLPADAATTQIAAAIDDVARRVRRLYVHVDLDVLDASEGRANGYAG